MDRQLLILCLLTFLIHLIATLAYSVRIAGTRTGKLALSLALFNVLVLVSRTSNSFQAPLLAKRIEGNLASHALEHAATDFRWLLLATSLATLLGALLIPTAQRLFGYAVLAFARQRSLPLLARRGLSRRGVRLLRRCAALPTRKNLGPLEPRHSAISRRVIVLNFVATAVSTVGVFSALYAGYLDPALRVTASNLSATIFLAVFIDPALSLLTDDVAEGRASEGSLRRSIVWLIGSRLVGTVAAQVLLVPAASLIVALARYL